MLTLRQARATRLLTVRALAERARIAPSTVYLIENGRSIPSFRVMERLSTALGVEPEAIAEFADAIRKAGSSPDKNKSK
jgi:transcriptional regulator with XRE-family HTH domain